MKQLFIPVLIAVLILPYGASAQRAGLQVGAEQDRSQSASASASTSPSGVRGNSVANDADEASNEAYFGGEPAQTISGDGVPNKTQDSDVGMYGVQNTNAEKGVDGSAQVMTRERAQTQEDFSGFQEQVRAHVEEQQATEEGVRAQIRAEREGAEVATQSLIEGSSLLADKGQSMAQLAVQLQTRNDELLETEARIRNRSNVSRFFLGGDDEAVTTLTTITTQNRETLQELNRLLGECVGCDTVFVAGLQESVRVMEKEQVRIDAVATQEQSSRGIFDRLFGWLK